MSDNIVVDWLKSVKLELYTQAFLDNGYDELEVCKQIGGADLDAIGVHNGVHREILLQAVTRLREEGGTSVYFTLENTDVLDKVVRNDTEHGKNVKLGTKSSSSRRGPPKVKEDVLYQTFEQLRKRIGDKLIKDGIDLACPPYLKPDNSVCHSSLAALAVKYTDQLKSASLQDVYKCLEELWVWRAKGPNHYYAAAFTQQSASSHSLYSSIGQGPTHHPAYSGHSPYTNTGQTPQSQYGGSCKAGHNPYSSSAQKCQSPYASGAQNCQSPYASGAQNCQSPYASGTQNCQSPYASGVQNCQSPYASGAQACHSPYASSNPTPVHATAYPMYASSGGVALPRTNSQLGYGSPGSQPPPVPSSLPPSTSHVEKNIDLHSVHTRYIYDNTGYHTEPGREDLDGKDDDKKKSSTLGRFFRNIGLRKSGKKHSYKPHKGDPNAYDITMDDDDRMALMLMVKEGKITTEHALQVVKKFEEERRKDHEQREKALKKKKRFPKPVKSPSATYTTGTVPRCDVCSGFQGTPQDLGYPTGNMCVDPSHQMEYSQHRRVHSVGHIDHAYLSRSPEGTRSLNCTPTHCAMSRSSAVSTPVSSSGHPRLYSPVFPQDPRLAIHNYRACYQHHSPMPSGGGAGRCHTALGVRVSRSEASPGVGVTREDMSPGGEASRSGSCVDHSPSTTSFDLVSSESEHSIDCQSQGHAPRGLANHRDSGNYLSNTGAIATSRSQDRNGSPQVQGVWQKGGTQRNSNGHQHTKDSSLVGASPKSASSESNHSNHSADSSGLCSYHSASPNVVQTGVLGDDGSGSVQVSYVQVHTDFVPTTNHRDILTLQKADVIRVLYKPPGDVWRGVLKGKTGWFRVSCVEPLYTGETPLEPWLDKRINNQQAKPKTVQEVLHVIGLENLETVFIQNGFDQLDCFADIEEEDLDLLGIFDPLVRTKLLNTADLIKNTEDMPTLRWKQYPGRTGPPVAFVNKEYRHGPSYAPSQDSGCYASFEHLAQRDAFPTTGELKQQYSLHSNKENVSPGYRAPSLGVSQCGRDQSSVASSGSVEDIEKSDKDYTAEDREVSEITRSVDFDQDQARTGPAAINDLSRSPGETIVMCSFAGTQTSPTYGRANCDNVTNNHLRQSIGSDHVSSSHTQDSGGHVGQTSPQPFPRKCVPRKDWNCRDVQVQVMCPLGSLNLNSESVQHNEVVPSRLYTAQNTPPTSLVLGMPQGRDSYRTDEGGYRSVGQNSRRSMSADRATKCSKPDDPPQYRTVMNSLLSQITSKLVSENIDLALEPYSTKIGECGIPPLLVQRYADELRQDLVSVALVVDQVRVQQLCSRHRPAVLSRDLPEFAAKACEIKIASIPEFFTSIGLPMYTNMFVEENLTVMEDLLRLNFEDIRDITRTHAKHVKRISHALEWVRTRITTLRKTSAKDAAVMDRV